MKIPIFNNITTSCKNKWALHLGYENNKNVLTAVDKYTGEHIANLIILSPDYWGHIKNSVGIVKLMECKGYDPYQYGHKYTNEGGLIL